MGEVEIIWMLIPSSDRMRNIRAAIPDSVFMPIPTTDTLAMPLSTETPPASTSAATASASEMARSTDAVGTVNEMSVVPSWETFWTIMSTLMPAAASGSKREAATPGVSGTP